ncbi:hypothetical protein ACFLUH_04270 [Chloroflexota bacterium]
MWRKKKFFIPVLAAVAIIAGSLGGAVLADESEDTSQPGAAIGALWERACEIYEDNTGDTIDTEALKNALSQAREERQGEALQNRLQNLVEEGKITQEEADELQDWYDSKPDVLTGKGLCGDGGFRGKGGMTGFNGSCPFTE